MENIKNHYYVSNLYGRWYVFRDGMQFAGAFENEVAAKDFIAKILSAMKKYG